MTFVKIIRWTLLAIAAVILLVTALAVFTSDRNAEAGQVLATYYGEELRNSPTTSGEPFNPDGFTAAHKTLPLGTRLQVCKDSCTMVRINDRGPYSDADLDLSESAAKSIGLDDEGKAPVTIAETSEAITKLPDTGGIKLKG